MCLGLSVPPTPAPPTPPHPRSLPDRAQVPPTPQDGYRTGEKRGRYVAWLPGGLPRRSGVKPTGPGLTPPSSPSPRPQGPRGAGLRSLRAAPGRTHPAGEAPSLPAAPCCHLVAVSGDPHPFLQHWSRGGAPELGGRMLRLPVLLPPRATEALYPQNNPSQAEIQISEPLTDARPSSPRPHLSPL